MDYLFGKDGTASARKGQALLILLDLNLPDMTGIDILKRVKESKYLKSTPVVVLTTTDDSHEIKRCYELGCNVYITKPVNYESFANAIRQLGLFFSVIQVPPAAPCDAADGGLFTVRASIRISLCAGGRCRNPTIASPPVAPT